MHVEQAREAVQQRMWTRVLEHFVVFPIEADLPYQQQHQQQQEVKCVSSFDSIVGLSGASNPSKSHKTTLFLFSAHHSRCPCLHDRTRPVGTGCCMSSTA